MDSAQNKRYVLLIAILAAFLTPFMGSSVNIALPTIGIEFSMNAVMLGWVTTAYLLATAIFLVPFGRIADIYGRKKIFGFGISLFTISAVFCVLASSGVVLIIFRAIQGIASAMIFGTSIAMLTSVFGAGERGKVLGIVTAVVYVGLSTGPFLGGFLTQHFGWRSIFLFIIPLGVIIVVIVLWKLKGEWAEAKGEPFDLTGSILYGFALVAIIYGFSLQPSLSGAGLIMTGIIGIFIFIRWEIKTRSPILNMHLFKNNKVFALSNCAAMINYSATFAVGFLLSLYLQYIKGLRPQDAGLVLVSQPIVMAIFSPFAGRLADKIEPRIVASCGMGITVIGLSLLTFIHENTSLGYIVSSLILLGFGLAFFSSPNTTAVMSSIDKKFYGVGSGVLGTMRVSGQMFSMGFAMLIFAIYLEKAQIAPSNYPVFIKSVKTIFLIFSGLCFGGIFASLARGKMRGATDLK